MRYKKKGAGMPKGARNGMYMNGGKMYATGGAVPGGTAVPTAGVAFYKQNVPEVELAGAAGNPEAAKVHEFSYTAIPGVFTSNQTPAGQKVFYDEHGKQFTPEALRAQAEKNAPRSRPDVPFQRGASPESSPDFHSMQAAVLMTDYEKELAKRGQQRADARRAGTFDPNANYNQIPIPAGYSTSSGQISGRYDQFGEGVRHQQNQIQTASHTAFGKNKQGEYTHSDSLSDAEQPVYYAGQTEVSPTQMVLNSLRYGGQHGKNIMRALQSADPARANRINQKKAAWKERRAERKAKNS